MRCALLSRRLRNIRRPPNIPQSSIIDCLRANYELDVKSLRYLPIGYDLNAYVYEAVTTEETSYFVKIRAGATNPPGLVVLNTLIDAGIPNILAPIRTISRTLWCAMGKYSLIVFPFIRGEDAARVGLTDR